MMVTIMLFYHDLEKIFAKKFLNYKNFMKWIGARIVRG